MYAGTAPGRALPGAPPLPDNDYIIIHIIIKDVINVNINNVINVVINIVNIHTVTHMNSRRRACLYQHEQAQGRSYG